ncbi:hypothetical protein IWW42_000292 [Coemansia sp. RSA 1085]|nr:hypothetical protein IWW42_000292 [Coemansia sp. RSA 1085]
MSIASSMGDEQATSQSPYTSNALSESELTSDAGEESEYQEDTEPEAKRTRIDEGEALLQVEHNGLTYFTGDHVIMEDPENSGGTQGTECPSVAQIHKLTRRDSNALEATVLWYVHPQLTPHPAFMEFYPNTLLRTFRQTTVPVQRIQRKCFVLSPADAMVGHPREWQEGDRLFVCESRYVDKGGFIQKIKMARGFWPESMSQERIEMVTRPVPWPGGPRQMEKVQMPVVADKDDANTPHTRRSTRLAATPASASSTPTSMPASQAELFQQMLVQQQQQQQLQQQQLQQQQQQPPPQFLLPGAMSNASMAQFQKQAAALASGAFSGSFSPVATASSMPIAPPRRRGRPPKNKQLIEKRAMEDAAAMAAAQQKQQFSQLQATPRRQPGIYMGRPLSSPATGLAHNGTPVSIAHSMAALNSPQMLGQSSSMSSLPPMPRPQPPPQPPKVISIPYPSSESEPQLSESVVSMFPTVNGRIKWFATAPISRSTCTNVQHSQEYLRWKQSNNSSA